MSLCTLGHAAEFAKQGVAVNSLWPLTAIDTAAVRNVIGIDGGGARSPEIMADAAHAILSRPARDCTGNFFIDEEVLLAQGVTDLSIYAHDPQAPLMADFFLPDDVVHRSSVRLLGLY